jgi:hypothetical protein
MNLTICKGKLYKHIFDNTDVVVHLEIERTKNFINKLKRLKLDELKSIVITECDIKPQFRFEYSKLRSISLWETKGDIMIPDLPTLSSISVGGHEGKLMFPQTMNHIRNISILSGEYTEISLPTSAIGLEELDLRYCYNIISYPTYSPSLARLNIK